MKSERVAGRWSHRSDARFVIGHFQEAAIGVSLQEADDGDGRCPDVEDVQSRKLDGEG